jgi:hypothetical protein
MRRFKEIGETSPHYKFAKYWEAIGCPELEVKYLCGEFGKLSSDTPSWFENQIFRIKGDLHWELRREWVDSDFTLPLEFKKGNDDWTRLEYCPIEQLPWSNTTNYQKAKTKQDETMTEIKPTPLDVHPLDVQIGGNHYKFFAIQPIEFITKNDISFIEGNVIKRMCRHNKPTGKGRQDIEKAIHELQCLLELQYNNGDTQ